MVAAIQIIIKYGNVATAIEPTVSIRTPYDFQRVFTIHPLGARN